MHQLLNRRRLRARRGFSLVELLVAFTILAILGAMLTRFLLAQSRFTEHHHALSEARMVSRHAMNVLESELRMVQDSGGVEAASSDGKSITALVPYRFGLYCGANGGVSVMSMLPVDSLMVAEAVFAGYAWRSQGGAYTNVFSTTAPATASNSNTCTGTGASQAAIRTFALNGRSGAVMEVSPAAAGATKGQPVYFFQRITYEFRASGRVPGAFGLYRRVQNGRSEELLAPFDADARFKYWTDGATASVAAAPAVPLIRGLDVVLSSQSTRTASNRTEPTTSSVVATIFFRNVRRN